VVSGAGLWGLTRNLTKLTLYTLYGWGLVIAPALLIVAINLKYFTLNSLYLALKDTRFWTILLWVCPTLAYYILIHMGQQGLVFVFLPALLLLSAAAVYNLKWPRPLYRQLAIAVLVMANALIFLLAPTYPVGGDRLKLLTADTLHQHDSYYLSRIAALPQNFPESHALILSSQWRFPQYYLPQYLLAPYGIVARWELGEGKSTREGEIWVDGAQAGLKPDSSGFFYVVIFDDELLPFNQTPDQQKWLELPDGQRLAYLRFTSEERFYMGPQSYGVVPAPHQSAK
jgi:hypothetical protein